MSFKKSFDEMLGLEFGSPYNALHKNKWENGYTFMGIYKGIKMWLTLLIGILGWIVLSFLYFFLISLFFTEAYSPNPKYNTIGNEFTSIFLIILSILWCYGDKVPLVNSIIYVSFFIIAHLLKELQMATKNKKYTYPIFVGPIIFYFL